MAAAAFAQDSQQPTLVLVARKGGYGLPTACPVCLPVYLYLRLAAAPFRLEVNTSSPDADHIPYVESGEVVAFNNEKGGSIQSLKELEIVDLNSKHPRLSAAEIVPAKAMINSWLADAVQYELWLAADSGIAFSIYFADLPWPIGRLLHMKKSRGVGQRFGLTKLNIEEKEQQIYRKAGSAYESLSAKLGDQEFFFNNRPTDVDALFLGHALFVLQVLPEESVLRNMLSKHQNLVNYANHLKSELLQATPSLLEGSSTEANSASATAATRGPPNFGWSYKPKQKSEPQTEEAKRFKRRTKYFLAAQLVAVVIFLSLMGDPSASEFEHDEDIMEYEEG